MQATRWFEIFSERAFMSLKSWYFKLALWTFKDWQFQFNIRGAIGGKTGKTVVLPWFWKIECGSGSGGEPQCYGGFSLPLNMYRVSHSSFRSAFIVKTGTTAVFHKECYGGPEFEIQLKQWNKNLSHISCTWEAHKLEFFLRFQTWAGQGITKHARQIQLGLLDYYYTKGQLKHKWLYKPGFARQILTHLFSSTLCIMKRKKHENTDDKKYIFK